MVKIAIAGGSGGMPLRIRNIGRTHADFLHRSCPGNHRCFSNCEEARDYYPVQDCEEAIRDSVILDDDTNEAQKFSTEDSRLGVTWRSVTYANKSDLIEALRGIHTVLSFVQVMTDPENRSQKNLIDAAIIAGVKRFAPSEWAR